MAGGDHGSGGAVMLASESALRSGTGLLSVATRASHVAPLLTRRPEAMVHAVESGDALEPMLVRADVVALGPGLGRAAGGGTCSRGCWLAASRWCSMPMP
jgi:NAD(P)H-hydrate epimerase